MVKNTTKVGPEPFVEPFIAAALNVRAAQPDVPASGALVEPLTAAELRILKLLPTSTYPQISATLYVSHITVKTHLRSIFQKLGVSSRAQAVDRAVDLRLLRSVRGRLRAAVAARSTAQQQEQGATRTFWELTSPQEDDDARRQYAKDDGERLISPGRTASAGCPGL